MHWSQRVRDQQAQQQAADVYAPIPAPSTEPRPPRPPRPKRPKPAPNPEADHVLRLCREGRLYELEKWVAEGGTLAMPPDYKQSPLRIALDKGFHSLIEFLLRHGADQAKKDDTLRTALLNEQPQIAMLALDYGADPKSVSFFDALVANSPPIATLLLKHSADPITDYPFPRAFQAGIRSTLRTFLECRRLRPDLGNTLQEHLDMALRQACSDGRERLAGLLAWAGANPRARGLATEDAINPTHSPTHVNEEELKTTAVQSACAVGSTSMLRTFRISADKDDLSEILCDACWSPKPELVRWLLKRGANPNDKPNGGSSLPVSSRITHARPRHARFADGDAALPLRASPTYQNPVADRSIQANSAPPPFRAPILVLPHCVSAGSLDAYAPP